MKFSNTQEQFFELIRAGLFPDKEARILEHGSSVDWRGIYRLAEEQAVMGLIAAGIENLPSSERPAKEVALQFAGQTIQLEQRNKAMNAFVAKLIEQFRKEDVYTLLVKGQGIAQCYERPLWRACGDIDLLLSPDNFEKASSVLDNYSRETSRETSKDIERKHREYHIDGWTVELHGTMHTNLSRGIDRWIDKVQEDVFYGGNVRSWINGETQVFLPRADEDVVFVFTHILQHLFLEGIGLRQICDWCRLLYTYRESLNYELLEQRIKRAGLITEWKVFASLAVQYLGMPESAMPMFGSNVQEFKWEAARLMDFVLKVGNFGHNREVEWSNGFKRRTSLIWHRITDTFKLSFVFPLDAPKFLLNYAVDGVRGLMRW